jgi:C4-dicarboxylate-specific signal transduction histidine kinase
MSHGTPSSLATRSLILVLCGYLVGITASHICSPAMEGCALAAATIGLIAQGVFASHSRQRQVQHEQLAIQKATVRLERRVEQHVRIPSVRHTRRLRTTSPRSHEQYITVVRSPRAMW